MVWIILILEPIQFCKTISHVSLLIYPLQESIKIYDQRIGHLPTILNSGKVIKYQKMTTFQGPKSSIHPIARGFLVCGEEIILCRVKDAKWFFLPGGHIKDGESAEKALLRELNEETGNSNYTIKSFIGVCENIFSSKENVLQHEINIIFEVSVPSDLKVNTKEDHIEFIKITRSDLKDCKILPAALKDGLIEWLKDGKSFFKEI